VTRSAYIETSIPSFYHENRQDKESQMKRHWTREWWDNHLYELECISSQAVISELERAPDPKRTAALSFLAPLSLLDIEPEIADIVETYIEHKLMPNDALGDAIHLAMASYYRCDFLVTWNCKHLANARKFDHIRIIDGQLGLHTPSLVTPLELMEDII